VTPACNVCGYGVEWLRSCYRSTWRLFRNAPDVLTPGRYYFSPEGTPHYPGLHHFGSRNWTSDERDPEPALGETSLSPRPYEKGNQTTGSIPVALVGDSVCVGLGDLLPLPTFSPARTLAGGIDSRCWLAVGRVPPIDITLSSAGGDVEGGTSESYGDHSSEATGGDVEGGSSISFPATAYAATGGDVEGGSSISFPATAYAATGGDVEGGSSDSSGTLVTGQATGGDVEGGSFTWAHVVVDT
jgi:hypothetical protein